MPELTRRPPLAPALAGAVALRDFARLWTRAQRLPEPALHVEILRWLEAAWLEGRRDLLLLVFRDAGKSSLAGLFAAWLLLRDPGLRVLVLSADQALAEKMVRQVRRIVERHPLTAGLRPLVRDQWAADCFTVARTREWRDPSMLARGLGGNITGCRADVVICDDVEVPDTCDTAPKREQLRARLAELDFVLVPGGTRLYIGTPHSYYSIYAAEARADIGEEAPFLAGFERLELPVLDGCGNSRWPERFTPARLAQIRRRSGPARFSAQMLLQPVATADGRLDADAVQIHRGVLDCVPLSGGVLRLTIGDAPMVGACCWWDPAFSAAAGRGDGCVIAAVFTDAAGGYWLQRMDWLRHDPRSDEPAALQLCRQAAAFALACHLPAVQVENNGLGRFLPGLLRRALAEAGSGAAVIERTSRTPKAVRILRAFDGVLAARALHVHEEVLGTPFLRQLREWRPEGRGADDGLDAVAGCLLHEPVRLGVAPRPPLADWRPGGRVQAARTDFEP